MKKTRLLALLLALCMVFSLLSAPALAADSSGSVSIQSSSDDDAEKKAEEKKKEEEKKKKEEEEKKKKEEEEKKKKEEEEKKKKEEEEKKKQEEEEKKKQEEEEKKKAEEEAKKKEEEEKKEEEKKSESADKSDSSGKSDSSDKSDSSGKSDSSDKSDSSGKSDSSDKSDSSGKSDSSDGSGSSSGEKSKDEGEKKSDGSDSEKDPGVKPQEGESSSSDSSQSQQEKEDDKDKEKDDDKDKDKDDDKDKDKDKKKHYKVVNDQKFDSTQTLTAASFSDYSNSTKKATGASVTYNRLITLQVTGLVADKKSAGKDNISHIESVMSRINSWNDRKEYANTMFKVVIPAGKYYIDCNGRCIHLYTNTWLSMNDVTLIKSVAKSGAIIRSGVASGSVSGYNGESNIVMEGGVVDANTEIHPKDYHFSGVRFGHTHDILIANVHFKGSVSGHHLELCGVKNISIVGCTFSDYKDSGYTKGINRNEAIQIDVTNGDNLTPTYAKYDDTVSGNVVVYKNTFQNLSRGVGSHSAVYGKYYDNIVIQSNTFTDIKNQAIHCENYRDCAIVGNKITKSGGGIDFNAMCFAPDGNYYEPHSSLPGYSKVKTYNAKTVISKNKISVKKGSSLSNASGIYVHGGKNSGSRAPKSYKNKTFRVTGVTVEKNTVTSARNAGVYLAYVGNYSLKGNVVSGVVSGANAKGAKDAKGNGIYLNNCAAGKIDSNTISDVKSHGLSLTDTTGVSGNLIQITGNEIDVSKNTGCIGVYLNGSSYVDVMDCTVNAKSYAVYVSGCSVVNVGDRDAGNILTTDSSYGVYVTGKSKRGITAQYNKITATKAATHAVKGSSVSASGNAIVVAGKKKKAMKAMTR